MNRFNMNNNYYKQYLNCFDNIVNTQRKKINIGNFFVQLDC